MLPVGLGQDFASCSRAPAWASSRLALAIVPRSAWVVAQAGLTSSWTAGKAEGGEPHGPGVAAW